jgi:acyl-CoA dehydrogenase family protein 9
MLDPEQNKLAEELLFGTKKKPSFAKELFFGRFDNALVFPYPLPSEAEKKAADEYVAKIQAFADAHIDPVSIDRNAKIPREVIDGLGELGLLSLTIPKEHGGLGLSQYAYCKAMEVIAGKCAATALFINAHQSVGLKALVLFGTPEQQAKWLPPLSKGKSLAAFSLTEANAGSDAAGVETKATYDPVKKTYSISGRKQWTTNGSIADILTVMARTPDGKITAFLVTPDMPGFKVLDAALDKVGMRGSTTSNLLFENVEVPESNILGPMGGGLKVCLTVLDYGRTTFGATCTGVAKDLIKRAKEYAVNRHQFKRPLAAFELVKEKISKMYALCYAMESTTYLTAGLIDKGVEDIMLESALLKVFNSDSLWTILYDTMQIFGGKSFFTDAPFERNMRDARLNMIGEGSNEVLRAFIGAVGLRDLGMELKGFKDSMEKSWFDGDTWKKTLSSGSRYLMAPEVKIKSKEADLLANLTLSFGRAAVKALAMYKEEIIEKQLVLNRLAEAAMALYTMTAVIARLETETDKLNLEIGKYYCKMAYRCAKRNLDNLFDPLDEETVQLSDRITGIKS